MKKKIANARINRGMTLLSMGIVLTLVLIAAPIGLQRYSTFLEEQGWAVTATHLSTVNQAARQYIKDNYGTLLNQVKGGSNVTVTGQTLRDKGYLPPGFSLSNNSSQNYILAITRNPKQANKLVAFVLTAGGQDMPFKAQRYIAQNTTGLGGYIYPMNIANGASGGWQINLSSMGLSGQQGHLVTFLTSDVLAGGAEESDRLYRYAVNGRPDLNRMHTAIDMNKNNIDNAGNISADSGAFNKAITAGSDITSNDGWLITKGNYGWQNSKWGGGFYMSDSNWIRTVNKKGIYSGGEIKSEGRLSTGEFIQLGKVAVAGTACTPNGLVGRDNNGGILTCQSGVWKGVGVGEAWFSPTIHQWQSINIGQHSYCALATANYDYNNWRGCQISRNRDRTWQLTGHHVGNGEATCQAVCF
ncbi:shufflon system plasmid conjugative transfer pilus tip adhesin PilV (plasmid) [Edwardsiella piscicida]|uniref:shufflon system plasmid conjugative transfer pilus tip adhesin PilV n=1 Tax=Edwardsiella TaxID=635 RepID=UPI001F345B61|nr:shufflon system plasmid conjugative transfer pilus tip adhesin PilV [Edwardsiella piscicida]UJT80919.1 shufflon system plasmid conjugative transfer pilus tip adhesin PilV [Edwardsiella piscicida]